MDRIGHYLGLFEVTLQWLSAAVTILLLVILLIGWIRRRQPVGWLLEQLIWGFKGRE